MKKFSILVASALVLGLTFTSCGSDDDSNENKSILGKWNFTTEKVSVNGVVVTEGAYSDNEEGCNKDYLDIAATTVVEGDYWTSDCDLDTYTSTYTRSGNTLTMVDDGETYTVEIVSVTSNTLKIKAVDTYEGATYTSEVTLTKA